MVDPEYNPIRQYFNKTGLDIKTFRGGVFTDYHDLGWDPMAGYVGATRDKNSASWVYSSNNGADVCKAATLSTDLPQRIL